MNSYKEYKKLRRQGYKALTAKRTMDEDVEFPHQVSVMPGGTLVVRQNGFLFSFTLTPDDDCILLQDLGRFTDTHEEGAISHDPQNSRTYNWFLPANFTPVSWFTENAGMSKHDADCQSRKEAREQYHLAITYGTDWEYHDLHCQVYLDQPELKEILLAESWLGGIDIHYDRMTETNRPWLSSLVDEQIGEILPEAFKKVAELHKAICGLTITTKAVHSKKVEELADELECFAATFLVMNIGEEITVQMIREWCDGTSSAASDADEYMDLLPEGYDLDEWVQDVYNHAEDLVDYYQSKHLSVCRHKCPS